VHVGSPAWRDALGQPLALARWRGPARSARLVGGVYAANTLSPSSDRLARARADRVIGSQHAEQVLIVSSLASGLLVLAWASSTRKTSAKSGG
jgi:hypothetical protein